MIIAINSSLYNSVIRTVSGDSSGTPSLARSRINKPAPVVTARIIDPLQVSPIYVGKTLLIFSFLQV